MASPGPRDHPCGTAKAPFTTCRKASFNLRGEKEAFQCGQAAGRHPVAQPQQCRLVGIGESGSRLYAEFPHDDRAGSAERGERFAPAERLRRGHPGPQALERRAVPQIQRVGEQLGRPLVIAVAERVAALGGVAADMVDVGLVAVYDDPIRAGPALYAGLVRCGRQCAAESADVGLQVAVGRRQSGSAMPDLIASGGCPGTLTSLGPVKLVTPRTAKRMYPECTASESAESMLGPSRSACTRPAQRN